VEYPSQKYKTCSRACLSKLLSVQKLGKKRSAEARASLARGQRASWANPDVRARRIAGYEKWRHSPEAEISIAKFTDLAKENLSRIHADQNIQSYLRDRSKWIFKKATEAFYIETNYIELHTAAMARFRREMPYDGPKEGSDYMDYCSKLCTAAHKSPECREIASSFMREAIPRFAEEWERRKKVVA
jgi:hypothetical protein